MTTARTGRRAVGIALLVGVAGLSGGCVEELGPVPMPLTRVQGVVKEGDRPFSGGWIEFVPVGGTIGILRSARLRPDGSFDADRVAIGTNAIRVIDAPIESPSHLALFLSLGWASLPRGQDGRISTKSPGVLFIPFATPIRRVIEAGPSAPLKIDVVEEAIRFQKERSRAMARTGPTATEEGP
jgi:hypothetical protein